MSSRDTSQRIRETVPPLAESVVAAKTRTPDAVAVVEAGATHMGENYVQDRMRMRTARGPQARGVTGHMSMRYLSMGMTPPYRVAREEGSNMVPSSTVIFGTRE